MNLPFFRQKVFTAILKILIVVVFLLALKIPFEKGLLTFNIDAKYAELTAGCLSRVILLVYVFFLLNKYRLKRINGLAPRFFVRNLQAYIIPIGIIVMGIISRIDLFAEAEPELFVLFGLSAIIVGMVEEFLFRGVFLPLIFSAHKHRKHAIYIALLLSSVIFALMHYINLFKAGNSFEKITSQVIFAFFIGLFFAGLFLRTGNILLTGIYHGLFNFAFGTEILKNSDAIETASRTELNIGSIIGTLVVYGLIGLSGILMASRVSREEINEKLAAGVST